MSMIEQTTVRHGKRLARLHFVNIFTWWRERQRINRDLTKLSEMPDHLLKDIGLEHLRDLKPDPANHYRW